MLDQTQLAALVSETEQAPISKYDPAFETLALKQFLRRENIEFLEGMDNRWQDRDFREWLETTCCETPIELRHLERYLVRFSLEEGFNSRLFRELLGYLIETDVDREMVDRALRIIEAKEYNQELVDALSILDERHPASDIVGCQLYRMLLKKTAAFDQSPDDEIHDRIRRLKTRLGTNVDEYQYVRCV